MAVWIRFVIIASEADRNSRPSIRGRYRAGDLEPPLAQNQTLVGTAGRMYYGRLRWWDSATSVN